MARTVTIPIGLEVPSPGSPSVATVLAPVGSITTPASSLGASGSITTGGRATRATGSITPPAKSLAASGSITAIGKGVVATGSIQAVANANLVDGECFTISDGTHTPTTFEFDLIGSRSNPPHVMVDVSTDTTIAQVASRMKTAIQSVHSTLVITPGTITAGLIPLTEDVVGVQANVAITSTVTASGWAVTGMSGGTDGVGIRETFTINDGSNAASVFEFTSGGAPSGSNIAVNIASDTSAAQVAARMKTAIQSVHATLTVTPGTITGSTIPLVNDTPGTAGNQSITDTVVNTGFTETGMSGGTAGVLDGWTFTLNDGVQAATIFEFDTNGSVTLGHVQVDISTDTSAAQVAARMKTAINATYATLGISAGTISTATIPLTNILGGTASNQAVAASDASITHTGMTGGLNDGCIDGETFTIDDGVSAKIFEFDTDGKVTSPHVQVNIGSATTDHQIALVIYAAINGISGFGVKATSPSAAIITLANSFPGVAGNASITDTVTDATFTHTGMANGTAGVKDGETFTIQDGQGHTKIFEFDWDSIVTPGNVTVTIGKTDSANVVAAAMRAAILLQEVAGNLLVHVSSGSNAVVNLACDSADATAEAITDTVAAAGFTETGMSVPTGTASVAYKLVGIDAGGNHSVRSGAGTSSAAPDTMNSTNLNRVTWTDPLNCAYVDIYRTTSPTSPATVGKIARVAAGVQTFDDTGLAGDGTQAPTTDTTGYGISADVFALKDLTVQVAGTFVATIQLEGSIDGANWLSLGSAITTPGFTNITPDTIQFIRCRMTAYTSGTPVVTLSGHEER